MDADKIKELTETLNYKPYKADEIGEYQQIDIEDLKKSAVNCIYLPIKPNEPVIRCLTNYYDLNEIDKIRLNEIRNQYIKIKLDTTKVNPDFLCHMLNKTELGKEIRNSIIINKENAIIYLPDLDKQKSTVFIHQSLSNFIDDLQKLNQEQHHKSSKTEQSSNLVPLYGISSYEEDNKHLVEKIGFLNRKIHNSIKSRIEAIKKLLEYNQNSGDSSDIEKISNIIDYINDECRNLLFITSKSKIYLSALIEEMTHKKSLIFSTTNIITNINISGDIKRFDKLLDTKLSYNILEIYTELLNNIVKHSLAKKVIIKIEVNYNFLSILILDNGEEFDLDEYEANNSKGYGLDLIKALADNINADLKIKAMPLHGTYRTLRVEI